MPTQSTNRPQPREAPPLMIDEPVEVDYDTATRYEAARAFRAVAQHQTLTFEAGDDVPRVVARELQGKGCPIRPVA